jgi:HEAT repeat protein
MNVKSSAIRILGKFEDSDAVEKVLSFTLSNQAEIRNVALSVLESNRSIDKDFYKLLVIIRRTVIDGQSLKFMDSLYLWWYCRQHPELNHIKKCLREWNKQRQK